MVTIRVAATSDLPAPLSWLRGAFTGALLHFKVLTKPVPAARPRVTRTGHAYYPKNYAAFLGEAQRQLAAQRRAPVDVPCHAAVEIILERPKKTVRVTPPGDADNYAKGVLDAATSAGLISDDTLIETLAVHKRWAVPGEEPQVQLWIGAK